MKVIKDCPWKYFWGEGVMIRKNLTQEKDLDRDELLRMKRWEFWGKQDTTKSVGVPWTDGQHSVSYGSLWDFDREVTWSPYQECLLYHWCVHFSYAISCNSQHRPEVKAWTLPLTKMWLVFRGCLPALRECVRKDKLRISQNGEQA